jgi:hypothetical protein
MLMDTLNSSTSITPWFMHLFESVVTPYCSST